MSTKIYNGFRIPGATTLSDVLEIVNKFRPFILSAGEDMMDLFIEVAYPAANKGSLLGALQAWDERRLVVRNTGQRDPGVDTEFRLVFFPVEDGVLGIAYTEHRQWFEEWLKQPGVEEYRYWNNTDRPEDISDEDWDRRGDLWSKVMQGRVPSEAGFAIDVHASNGPMPRPWRK